MTCRRRIGSSAVPRHAAGAKEADPRGRKRIRSSGLGRALGPDHRSGRQRGVPARSRRGSSPLVEPRGRGGRPTLFRHRLAPADPERSMRGLVDRVVGSIASWALEAGQVGSADERDALREELAALVLTQRGTFATPVWLNAGLTERPLTSACFILHTEDSIPELLDWNRREGTDLPAGRRGWNQPLPGSLLARARLARRTGERSGVVHARHRCMGGDDPGRRPGPAGREDDRARRLPSRHLRVHRRQGA